MGCLQMLSICSFRSVPVSWTIGGSNSGVPVYLRKTSVKSHKSGGDVIDRTSGDRPKVSRVDGPDCMVWRMISAFSGDARMGRYVPRSKQRLARSRAYSSI